MSTPELLSLSPGSLYVRVTPRRGVQLPGEPVLMPILGEYRVYDSVIYDLLTHDEVRNRAYQRAIRRYAPGSLALDIGTGRDVNWARACVKAGARHVYAIEELGESFDGARATIARLGLTSKITLVQGNSTEVELPEKVSLCVSEIIGSIGSCEGAPAILRDARQRLLQPWGRMIPERCSVRVAAVELPESIHSQPAFSYGWATYLRRVFERFGHPFDIKVHIDNLPESSLISNEDVFEDFDFTSDLPATSLRTSAPHITRRGRIDGFATRNLLWCLKDDDPLDAYHQGGTFSPSPFFPVFYPGVDVAEGDTIEMTCETRLSENGALPDYHLRGELRRQGAQTIPFSYDAPYRSTQFRTNAFYTSLFPV